MYSRRTFQISQEAGISQLASEATSNTTRPKQVVKTLGWSWEEKCLLLIWTDKTTEANLNQHPRTESDARLFS